MNNIAPPYLTEIDTLPYCIQGSEAPAFRGEVENGERFCCTKCSHILIEHYIRDDYASIGIKCFKCGEISRTPSLVLGEVFSASTVTLGDKGTYLLGSTVNTRSGVILTCDQEIQREIAATAPKEDPSLWNLTPEGLKSIAAKYDAISNRQLEIQRKIVERLGASAIKTLPFAWAISHLEKCLCNKIIETRADTVTALMWLNMFWHVVNIWEHHPRFLTVARGLTVPKSFLHTSAQLLTAAYLYRAGNRVGLSLEDKHGEPNPDLYIRVAERGKLFLEVKAPEALQWGGEDSISTELIETAVKTCVKKSGAQINRSHHGVLIISSSCVASHYPEMLEKAIQKAINSKGRDHRSLAAVVGLSPRSISFTKKNDSTLDFNIEYHFSVTLNKYYNGENPVRTDSLD
jgi:hypothetical protein